MWAVLLALQLGVFGTLAQPDRSFKFIRAAYVWLIIMVVPENWIDHHPSGLHGVLMRKQRSIADHGITQQPLVRRFFSRVPQTGRALVVPQQILFLQA